MTHKCNSYGVRNLTLGQILFDGFGAHEILVQPYGELCHGLYSLVDSALNRVEFMVDDEEDEVLEIFWHSCCCDPTEIFGAMKARFPKMSFFAAAAELSVLRSKKPTSTLKPPSEE